ncbi:MAG: TIGR03032 family protein [Desulfovibrio sp.]|jgi:hypothetical protein|nr:TIGR03032 family protein [Desulfovibrio sp.]
MDKLLLSCVNSAVSLVGYDFALRQPFWYCPGNVLRACGICAEGNGLWVASDNALVRLTGDDAQSLTLPGPHDNFVHSVKILGENLLGLADTGNSRILLRTSGTDFFSLSPLEGWGKDIPLDAIHLNDMISWREGLLVSAFNYQPFAGWKNDGPDWKNEGWGVIYYLRRHKGRTASRIVATGLNCPHSLCQWQDDVYCCSSAQGEFYCLQPDRHENLREKWRIKVTDTHFLRGILRVQNGWVLGGSSRRHQADGGGMALFFLADNGDIETLPVAAAGEIYDILPWNEEFMPGIADTLMRMPKLDLKGEFPPRCALSKAYFADTGNGGGTSSGESAFRLDKVLPPE